MKKVTLLETHQEILDAHMQGDSPELGLYIPYKEITNTATLSSASKFEIGRYYPEYGVYAGIYNQNYVFVAGEDLRDSDKRGFAWREAMDVAEKIGLKLPTIGECALIAENREAIQKGLEDNGLEKLDGWYWSSSEYSTTSAWYSTFNNSYGLDWYSKYDNTNYVRPVLALPLQF